MERRAEERKPLSERVRIGHYPSATSIAELVNLSACGAMLRASLNAQARALVRCRLLHQDGPRLMILELSGYVVRTTADGFAIEWDESSSARLRARLQHAESVAPAAPAKRGLAPAAAR